MMPVIKYSQTSRFLKCNAHDRIYHHNTFTITITITKRMQTNDCRLHDVNVTSFVMIVECKYVQNERNKNLRRRPV